MGKLLKGKSAVVTGAGRGIGRAIALALAAEGANVVANDLGTALDGTGVSRSPSDDVTAEINRRGGKAIANYDSVAEYESSFKIIKACINSFGAIDILINAAGNIRNKACLEMTPEEWDAVIKVHLYGTFYCSKHAGVYMKEQKLGRIISMTSTAYLGSVLSSVNYCAAKGGIVSLMRSMALQLAAYGITCNSIAPGAATRMTCHDNPGQTDKEIVEGIAPSENMVDLPGPEFVAPAVVYLASDYGANISGVVLDCAGGKISVHSLPQEVRAIFKDYRKDGPWTVEELNQLIPRTIEPYCPPLKPPEHVWG